MNLPFKLDRQNVIAVARREYLARGRTRTFKISTVILVLVGIAAALSPLIFRYLDQGSGEPTTIEVWVGDANTAVDAVTSLGRFMNVDPNSGASAGTPPPLQYRIVAADSPDNARARVIAGESAGLLLLSRGPGDFLPVPLSFEYIATHTGPSSQRERSWSDVGVVAA